MSSLVEDVISGFSNVVTADFTFIVSEDVLVDISFVVCDDVLVDISFVVCDDVMVDISFDGCGDVMGDVASVVGGDVTLSLIFVDDCLTVDVVSGIVDDVLRGAIFDV